MGIGSRLYYSGGGDGGDTGYPPLPPRRPDGDGNGDPCDIEINVLLQSVNLELLHSLQKGQILTVEVVMEHNRERLCAKHNGQIVGAIVSPFATKIIACIQQGNQYNATVMEITGNQYRVRVKKI